ncbi:MAG: rod shape-determining protein MreC [Rikenellaceae bacterium]
MYRLIEFIRSIYVVVLFVVLECCAISYYAHSTIYTQAQMLSYSNNVVGGVQGLWSGVRSYFYLSSQNSKLTRRVALLERELAMIQEQRSEAILWAASRGDLVSQPKAAAGASSGRVVGGGLGASSGRVVGGGLGELGDQAVELRGDGWLVEPSDGLDNLVDGVGELSGRYSYMVATVVSNSINKLENYIVVNRGERDGVRKNMALLSSSGEMIGYITATSPKYAVAVSILNTKFKTSGKIKGQEYMGSITWAAENRYQLEMAELSKYAEVNVGDTIVSTGYSQIFPDGVIIGTVASSSLNKNKSAHNVKIDISADISKLYNVIIVNNTHYGEVEDLMLETN